MFSLLNKKILMEAIRVLLDGERAIIKTSELDVKKHFHISGREFTEDEVKDFTWGVVKKAVKKVVKKVSSKKK